MTEMLTIFILAVLGLILGSFSGASVWRLRAKQLDDDRKNKELYDKKEYRVLKSLLNVKQRNDRSRCLHCGHVLSWHDLIPLLSWLRTSGKCAYCKKPIGRFEPIIEVGLALFFVISYLFWPFELESWLAITQFVLWLVAGVLLAILTAYDMKWMILPDRIVFPFIFVSVLIGGLTVYNSIDPWATFLSVLGALALLPGLYFAIWWFSKGAWVGFGDVKLSVGLSFLLVDWYVAFVALFAANLIGMLIALPGIISGKISRSAKIPFGPLLIIGTVIAMFWGVTIADSYLSILSY